ncbi:MAG: response regulator [Terriglobales bacterium]|jgi:CheY-like chemotaxis protein
MTEKAKVLVVDDESAVADSLVAVLKYGGFDATGVYGPLEALEALRSDCPDILLSDVLMPKMSGIELAQAAVTVCPAIRIVLISGQAATTPYLEQARAQGYEFDLLPKPIHPQELLERLRS